MFGLEGLIPAGWDPWISDLIRIGAALAVLAFGVLDGMLIAVVLSLAAVIERFSRPAVAMLGQLGDSHDFVDVARHLDAEFVLALGDADPSPLRELPDNVRAAGWVPPMTLFAES